MILSDINYLEPISNNNQLPDEISGGRSFATVITDASSGSAFSLGQASSSGDITKSITNTSTSVINNSLVNTSTATGTAITFGIDSSGVTAAIDGGVSAFVSRP